MYKDLLNIFLCYVSVFSSTDDPMSSSVRSIKSSSFSTQENGDNERNTHVHRKLSVLDEKALREDDTKLVRDQRIQTISRNYQVILESIGEDPLRQGKISSFKFVITSLFFNTGLLKTPKRAAEVNIFFEYFLLRRNFLFIIRKMYVVIINNYSRKNIVSS